MSLTVYQCTAVAAGLVAGIIYYIILARASRNNRLFFKTLWILAGALFLLRLVLESHVIIGISEGGRDWFSTLIIAAFHSLEQFVFTAHFFDTGYQTYYFGWTDIEGVHPGHYLELYCSAVLFVLASITSIALVIRALNRRRAGRAWLSAHQSYYGNSHIFFMGGEVARTMAADIKRRHPDHCCIFVGYPDPKENYMDLSIWEKIKRLFESLSEDETGPFDAVVYSRMDITDVEGRNVCEQLGLPDLAYFICDPASKVYLLGESEEANLKSTELLYQDNCRAEIFCRASREGVNRMYEEAMTTTPSMRVRLIDSSYLAVRNIKNCPEQLPVQFVEKGRDAEGRLEGWVAAPFKAAILGFGETGREALGFLFEHGSFVDKCFKRNPFSCAVYDSRMKSLEQAYRRRYPGMNEDAGIEFMDCEVGGNKFWEDIRRRIRDLNYIIVCLGNDRLNLNIAIELAEYAFRQGKDLSHNFVILADLQDPTELDKITLTHYNTIGPYHGCIRTFGSMKEVWTYDNITNESLTANAKAYFAGYKRAEGNKEEDVLKGWDAREKEICEAKDYARYAKLVRQRSQDYANCFHVATKMALIGPEIYEHRKEIAAAIPADFDANPVHYTGDDPHVEKVLEYLSVLEHIRWETSHVAMGYTRAAKTDEVLKTHSYIVNYDDLSPKIKHYDYLVVKATLDLN